ncbi:MAG: mycofactocin radical SAM maturase [Syntrophorhabdales bacterium]|jgi:mycofactocin radical SAM maturase
MKHESAYKELLKAPVNVTWEITDRCNLECLHCLSADLMEKGHGELGFDECVRFIDELDRMEVFQINFGGGEPFLRADFLDILHYAHSRGITTCVSTNGTLLDRTLVGKLQEMDLLYLQVSLDGATRETNDRIRGEGSYDLIMFGIELLARYRIPNFSINTVVTRINFREIKELYELAHTYGAKTRLSRFRPSGNGKRAWGLLRLDRHQLLELSLFLESHKDVLTGDSFFSIASEARRDLGLNMCGAAKITLSVTPDGRIYPCAFLQDERFLAGNVTTDALDVIWHGSPVFQNMRSIAVESCQRCARFSLCHGGCPAVAYYLTDSLHFHDPECLFNLQHVYAMQV